MSRHRAAAARAWQPRCGIVQRIDRGDAFREFGRMDESPRCAGTTTASMHRGVRGATAGSDSKHSLRREGGWSWWTMFEVLEDVLSNRVVMIRYALPLAVASIVVGCTIAPTIPDRDVVGVLNLIGVDDRSSERILVFNEVRVRGEGELVKLEMQAGKALSAHSGERLRVEIKAFPPELWSDLVRSDAHQRLWNEAAKSIVEGYAALPSSFPAKLEITHWIVAPGSNVASRRHGRMNVREPIPITLITRIADVRDVGVAAAGAANLASHELHHLAFDQELAPDALSSEISARAWGQCVEMGLTDRMDTAPTYRWTVNTEAVELLDPRGGNVNYLADDLGPVRLSTLGHAAFVALLAERTGSYTFEPAKPEHAAELRWFCNQVSRGMVDFTREERP